MAVLEVVVCADCAAFMLTGSSSAAVLSENRAAASCARSPGSVVASATVVLASYLGSTNTKSLDEVGAASALSFVAGTAVSIAAFGVTATLAATGCTCGVTSITRGANGDIIFAVAGETSATLFGALTLAAVAACCVCSVST